MRPNTVVRALVVLATTAALAAPLQASAHPRHHPRPVPTPSWSDTATPESAARLRGLAPVSSRVAWVSGSLGTVWRTVDGGRHWLDVSPGGDAAALEFRDIEAWDSRNAVIMAAGEGEDSRFYRTSDGGAHWTLTYTNTEPTAFYDCFSFWDKRNGLAMSDPVDGRWRLLRTTDGGRSWRVASSAGMPATLPGEAGFAASGTCLVTSGRSDVWLAGGGTASRVWRSSDRGRTWRVTATSIPADPAGAGIFSLAVRGKRSLVAVGGNFNTPEVGTDFSAVSTDGGRRFRSGGDLGGYRSGSAWLPRRLGRAAVVAVGPTGSDLSRDGGRSWTTFDTSSLDSVETTRDGAVWASGAAGRVAVLRTR
ncbi:oxidoreductase [Angustibacter aerolatus]